MPFNVPMNPPLCSLVSFLTAFLTPSGKILEFSRAYTIFIMLFISLFEIIKVTVPEPCFVFVFWFFLIPASIAEAAAVIPNGAKKKFPKEPLLSLMDLLIYLIMILKTLQIELF